MTNNSHKWLWFLVLIIFAGVIIFMVTKLHGGCDYDGKHYNVGDSFTAADGCNTCFCAGGAAGKGIVGCTLMACPSRVAAPLGTRSYQFWGSSGFGF